MKSSAFALLAFASIITLSSGTSKEPNWRKMYHLCFELLRTSPESRALHNQDQFNPDPESQCVTRCAGIITGAYDDETGMRMKQWDAWRDDDDNDDAGFEKRKTKYQACAAKISTEQYGNDYCQKSALHHQCFMYSLSEE